MTAVPTSWFPVALLWLRVGAARRGRRSGTGRPVAAATLALVGVLVAGCTATGSTWTQRRLRKAMDAIAMPATFERVEDRKGGWNLCLDVCPKLTRTWIAPGSVEDVRQLVSDVLAREGFVLGDWRERSMGPELLGRVGHRGGLDSWVEVEARWVEKDGERLPLRPGQVSVLLTLEGA